MNFNSHKLEMKCVKSMKNKTFVLDTNVLLSDATALFSFEENNVILPMIVLEELDRHKDRQDEVGRNARETSRKLTAITKEHQTFNSAIPLGERLGELRILSFNSLGYSEIKDLIPAELDGKSGDNQILAVCVAFQKKNPETQMVLISRDILLRLKAQALGIEAEDYRKLHVAKSVSGLYTGITSLVGDYDIDKIYKEGVIELSSAEQESIYENEFLLVKNEGTDATALVRYKGNGKVQKINESSPSKITAKNKEQKFAIDLLMDPSVNLVTIVGIAGSGKEQPLDAKVLTPTGWTTMGEIKPGDLVVGRNGKPTKVLSIHPQGVKYIYRVVFSDGTSTECGLEHLWHTRTQKERDQGLLGSVRPLSEIISSTRHVSGAGKTIKRNHSIPMVEPVAFESRELPLHPYILGVLLGDGCMSQRSVSLSSADKELINKVRGLLPEDTKLDKKMNGKYNYSLNRVKGTKRQNSVVKTLDNLGLLGSLSYDKFVPSMYKFNSVETRVQLLQGLMDADGFISKSGMSTVFYTTSTQLAKDVQEVVWSLGGKAVIANRQTNYTYTAEKLQGRPSYAVHISLSNGIVPATLKRKADRFKARTKYQPTRYIDRVEYVGKKAAQCIYLDSEDHLYVTDDYIVTHNTLLSIAAGLSQVLDKKLYRSLIVCRPIQPLGKDIGFLPGSLQEKLEPWVAPIKDNLRFLLSADGKKSKRGEETLQMLFENGTIEVEAMTYIRGRSISNAFIIIDEAQNLNAHELKTIITRVGENTKIVLTGDVEQIDNMYVDSVSNGLTVAIERFKSYDLSGHVTLVKGERSRLATLAANILG